MSVNIKNNTNLSPNNETSPVPLKDEAEEINALSDNKVDVEIVVFMDLRGTSKVVNCSIHYFTRSS